jgi:hypothetical protein
MPTQPDRSYLDAYVIEPDGDVMLYAADRPRSSSSPGVVDLPSDLALGRIAERPGTPGCWGFTTTAGQDPAIDGSRLYASEAAAATSCAIQAVEGPAARAAHDLTQPTGRPTVPERPAEPQEAALDRPAAQEALWGHPGVGERP